MASDGPNLPGSGANDPSIGSVAWSDPANVTADDGAVASASPLSSGAASNYLKATGFNFSISAGASIEGIEVVWEQKREAAGNDVFDNAVRIVKGGVIGSTDRSDGTAWPTTLTDRTYGGSADLWGETWTSEDINASDFGAAISAVDGGGGSGASAEIDKCTITVHYNADGDVFTESSDVVLGVF